MKGWKQAGVAVLLALACTLALAGKDTLEELKAKLSSAKPSDQPKLCLEIAQ